MTEPVPKSPQPGSARGLSVARIEPIVYPETDGRPMPDGSYQSVTWRYLLDALEAHYHGRGVYVAGDMFVYLEEGNPANCIAPDVFVVQGASDHKRDIYKVWEEPGGMPDFVLEIVSPGTWRADVGEKRDRYASLGVREYWLHDPHGRYLQPPLAGFRLVDGSYVPLPSRREPRGLSIRSDLLGLDLVLDGEDLRFFDPVGERLLPPYWEFAVRHEADQARIAELEGLLASEADGTKPEK